MPVVPCTENGKKGFKVENGNKCFTGPNARKKAEQQLKAIKISQNSKSKDLQWFKSLSKQELAEIIEGLPKAQQISMILTAKYSNSENND